MRFSYKYKSPIGILEIVEDNKKICMINYNNYTIDSIEEKTPLIDKTIIQLTEYFNGDRKEFDIPLLIQSTDFQKRVYDELLRIRYGEVCTYQDIAIRIGNKKSSRAVGKANNKNKIPIIIPCHRVIGKNNKLIGYGLGLNVKKYLLDLEKKYERNW